MIQRIQSIWLLAASACAFLTLKFSFYTGHLKPADGAAINVTVNTPFTAVDSIPIVILTVGAAIAALITIFLFKDRKLQSRIALVSLVASLGVIVLYFFGIRSRYTGDGVLALTCVFAFAVPVFLLLAIRSIYRDQRLVKSLDRLR